MADTGSEKLRVFSYSRRDSSDFADELVAGLELAGFAPFLDRHDIAAGEEWEARLGGLIQQADTVVFVVSPEAVKSDRCTWEVQKALALSKRLLPVIFKAVPDSDIPEQLRRRQFVRFDEGGNITRRSPNSRTRCDKILTGSAGTPASGIYCQPMGGARQSGCAPVAR